jgi:hypothetical protein
VAKAIFQLTGRHLKVEPSESESERCENSAAKEPRVTMQLSLNASKTFLCWLGGIDIRNW